MNLLETLEQAINYQLIFGLDGEDNKIKRASSNIEKIADDYAIEFAKWFDKKNYVIEIYKDLKTYEEVLQIFKKEIRYGR